MFKAKLLCIGWSNKRLDPPTCLFTNNSTLLKEADMPKQFIKIITVCIKISLLMFRNFLTHGLFIFNLSKILTLNNMMFSVLVESTASFSHLTCVCMCKIKDLYKCVLYSGTRNVQRVASFRAKPSGILKIAHFHNLTLII